MVAHWRWFFLALVPAFESSSIAAEMTGRPEPAARTNTPSPVAYLRVARPATNLLELQVAIRKFAPARGNAPIVWLTGVSHLGEAAYYQALQRHLETQALVLYEGVSGRRRTGENTPASTNAPGARPAGAEGFSLQQTMADTLGLVFQLQAIDYDRPNFANSDLTLRELQRLLPAEGQQQSGAAASKPGESLQELMQVMDGSSALGLIVNAGLRLLGSSGKLRGLAKLALMDALDQSHGELARLQGLPPDLRELLKVLIESRNRVVIRDLRQALQRKPRLKSLAVFYGAAHMGDLEQRLVAELNYRPVEERWLTAFAVDLQQTGITPADIEMVRGVVQWQLQLLKAEGDKEQTAPTPAAP